MISKFSITWNVRFLLSRSHNNQNYKNTTDKNIELFCDVLIFLQAYLYIAVSLFSGEIFLLLPIFIFFHTYHELNITFKICVKSKDILIDLNNTTDFKECTKADFTSYKNTHFQNWPQTINNWTKESDDSSHKLISYLHAYIFYPFLLLLSLCWKSLFGPFWAGLQTWSTCKLFPTWLGKNHLLSSSCDMATVITALLCCS